MNFKYVVIMDQAQKDVIAYLQNTLGVRSVYKTESESTQDYFALFSVEMLGTYAPSEIELLEKMIASLQWKNSNCIVCDSTQAARIKAKYKVHFVNSLEAEKQGSDHEVFVVSPRVLGLKPEYKKQAWDQLKKAVLWS